MTRFIFLLFFTFLYSFLYSQQNAIILSPIGPQQVYENARISVYFSTLKHFEEVTFTSPNLPSFGQIVNDGHGDGRIILDPGQNDVGDYHITLKTTSDSLTNETIFKISVLDIDEEQSDIYYLDPENGSIEGPGTFDEPFLDLQTFLEEKPTLITDNTIIFLRTGFHGTPVLAGTRGKPVKILAQAGHNPKVKKLSFSFTTNWYVSGLDISPQNANISDIENLITVFAGSKNIEISNCKIYPIEDASVWTTNEMWYAGSGNGIVSSGTECLFRNNYLKNTWFSVEMRKPYNDFSYNIINWFGADAIRAIANYQTVSYNQVKNATVYDYDHPTRPQHDDGIQSWTFNNPVRGIKIIGNQVVDVADPNLPLPTEIMQGIVDFDGFAEDWVVENNLVVTHHAHGIALYGAKNCKVVNNTVTRNPFNYFSPNFKPWIRINPRKETVGGDLSFGNLVRNNIMSTYHDEGLEPGTRDNNIITTDYSGIFEDYLGWNFHLAENSAAIDAGQTESTPSIDQAAKRRNVGLPDAGCFEKNATLTDITPPSKPGNIAAEIDQTIITLAWDESTDDTEVSHYNVIIDENRIINTDLNSISIPDLESGREYEIEIEAVDYFGNRSEKANALFVTEAEDLVIVHYASAHRHDQLIKSNLKLQWVGMHQLNIGRYFDAFNSSAVIPFQLPCIDTEREIVSGNIQVNLAGITNSPVGKLNLYLLGLRSKSDVLTSDYWSGPLTENTSGAILDMDFAGDITEGVMSLEMQEEENLGSQLQDYYNQGACNKYAFFRLNIDSEDEDASTFYSIYSSEAENSQVRPLLRFVTSSTSSVKTIEVHDGLTISPNPVTGSELNFNINNFITNNGVFEIHNSIGQIVYGEKVTISATSAHHMIDKSLTPGIYFAVLRDKEKFAIIKFVKK